MGQFALIAATVGATGWAATTGARRARAARLALIATCVATGLASLMLAIDLVGVDPGSRYASRFTSQRTPIAYRFAGLWGGMEGSMLVWSAIVLATFTITRRRVSAPALQAFDLAGAAITAAFLTITAVWASPFARLDASTGRGSGLPAVLQHPAMLYHPPVLYSGLAIVIAAAARTVAASWSGHIDRPWLNDTKRWLRASWLVLGLGMLTGSNWAYAELGWGGFWAWDPVENAALIPWLLTTIALHLSVIVERRGRLDAPLAATVALAGVATIVGVYVTRSGSSGSIHAFASSPAVGRAIVALAAAVLVIAVAGLVRLPASRWALRGREAALVTHATLMAVCVLIIAAGTFGPVVAELFGHRRSAVRPSAYTRLLIPVAVALLVAAAIAPSIGWRGRLRSRRRLAVGGVVGGTVGGSALLALPAGGVGACLVLVAASIAIGAAVAASSWRPLAAGVTAAHVGSALLIAGAAGSSLGGDVTAMVRVGSTVEIGGRTIELESLDVERTPRFERVTATAIVDGRRFKPELRAYEDQPVPTAEAAFDHRPFGDTIVLVTQLDPDLEAARITVRDRPLITLVWLGGIIMLSGGLVVALGSRRSAARTGSDEARCRPATPAPRTAAATSEASTRSGQEEGRRDRTPGRQ